MSSKVAGTVPGEYDEPGRIESALRFPEFLGQPLRDVQLGDVTEEATTRNGSKLAPSSVMGVRKEGGIVPMEERLVAGNISRYKIVRPDWFAYNPMRLNIGSIARWQGDKEVLVSPDYVVFRCLSQSSTSLIPAYLDHFRGSRQWEAFTNESGDGGVRIRIYYRDLARMRLLLPDVSEQQKIADCLSSIDALIAVEADKLEALKAHKQGLMQQLFPAPGETTPHLRFPGFQGAGEWETKSLGNLVSIQSGSTPSKANATFWNGSIPWVSAKDMKQFFLENTEDHISISAVEAGARLVPAGTLLMLTRGMTLLKDVPICVLRREMSCNQDVKALRPKSRVNGIFLAFALLASKRRLLKMVDIAGHGTRKLDTDELATFELAIPQLAEQQRIAEALTSIDTRITAQDDRITALKVHKAGLMQQLFPVVDEVQA